jgi:hypothetical protein
VDETITLPQREQLRRNARMHLIRMTIGFLVTFALATTCNQVSGTYEHKDKVVYTVFLLHFWFFSAVWAWYGFAIYSWLSSRKNAFRDIEQMSYSYILSVYGSDVFGKERICPADDKYVHPLAHWWP